MPSKVCYPRHGLLPIKLLEGAAGRLMLKLAVFASKGRDFVGTRIAVLKEVNYRVSTYTLNGIRPFRRILYNCLPEAYSIPGI